LTHTFSYIAEFKGGTYCSQVEAKDLRESLQYWLDKMEEQKAEIRHFDERTLNEIAIFIKDEDHQPVMLRGLKNIWFMHLPAVTGAIHVNIVKTDVF
jgi:hypothetical protein